VPIDLPPYQPPEPPTVTEDLGVVSVLSGGEKVALPDLPLAGGYRTVEIPASELPSMVDGFTFENKNSARRVSIRNLEIVDPSARGDAIPANPIETAQDARLLFNGVEVVRDSNTVDDLIPGVTLNLHRASESPVTVDIAPDRELAKDAIIEFVGLYNQVVRDINIYTRTDDSIIEEIEYFSEDERETAQERLGIFQGDTTLNQIRNRLQTIMMNPYPTESGNSLRLLAQIGISTNASGAATGGFNAGRLRGYLEISEDQLDRALQQNFAAVGQLFGRDTDGDLVMDQGSAVILDQFLSPYVRVGGIIATRTGTIDDRISRTEDRIERYNDRLEDYEQELRTDFAQMEGAMQSLQENAQSLDNLGQGRQNR
jgi:flagellar hook-associated protein 2